MTVRVYRSTDASAPVLTGAVGSLTALLDAILVNGYGALTAAGWTINQTGTNKRGYKQNTTGSNNTAGMLLYVDDTGPGGGGAREARVCGFETMTAITPAGTGQFPTAAQSSIGVGTLVVRKSTTADATARAWTCVANGQTIYLFIESGDNTAPIGATTFVFGDFKSYKASDQYAVIIMGRQSENDGSSHADPMHSVHSWNQNYFLNNVHYGMFIARHWTGVGGSIRCGKLVEAGKLGYISAFGTWNGDASTRAVTSNNGGGFCSMGRYNGSCPGIPVPNGPDNSLIFSPVYINHSGSLRGYFLGLWAPLHDRPLNHNDTFTPASGSLNGKNLLSQYIQSSASNNANSESGCAVVEYSDTWS